MTNIQILDYKREEEERKKRTDPDSEKDQGKASGSAVVKAIHTTNNRTELVGLTWTVTDP